MVAISSQERYTAPMRHILLLLCYTSTIFANIFTEKLSLAEPGDYLVTEVGDVVTVLILRDTTYPTFLLEEISIPRSALTTAVPSWKSWAEELGPGHTSRSRTEVDVEKGKIVSCYSYTKKSWLHPSSAESLFAQLAKIPLEPLPPKNRRKIGPPPQEGELDVRKLWNPPVTKEGSIVAQAATEAFLALWPSDGSPLANKEIVLYFAKESPFPCWVQIEAPHGTLHIRVLDSGKRLLRK